MFLPLLLLGGQAAADPAVVRYAKATPYDEVREDLEFAIQNRALMVDLTSRIHAMLQRTGKDLGDDTPLFENAQAYSFCSAKISRAIMAADAHNIAFCPFTIVVYTPRGEAGMTYVAYRRPPAGSTPAADAALRELQAFLDGIAREAVGLQ